jgi:hypothetical protein
MFLRFFLESAMQIKFWFLNFCHHQVDQAN